MTRPLAGFVLALALCGPALADTARPEGPANLSDAEKVQRAADSLARMKAALKGVLGRIEAARNEKDVVKLNCVNEKLTQVKSLLKVAEQADVAMHEAVAAKDAGADAEFAKIAIARTKIEGLRAEAEQCIGQLAYAVDERTTVEVEQPDDLPESASEKALGAPGPGRGTPFVPPPVVRPPPASPYR